MMVYHLSFPEVCQHNTWRESFLFDTLIKIPYDLGQFTKIAKNMFGPKSIFFIDIATAIY
jgi:hypothetical protein